MAKPRREPARQATLKDIAAACGVAKATVSYALAGNRKRVSDDTRKCILATARRLGYDPQSQLAARRLSLQKGGKQVVNHLVALFFPHYFVRFPYYMRLFRGVMDVLYEERFGLLANYDNSANQGDEILPVFARGEVDGVVVIANPRLFSPMLQQLRDASGFQDRPIAFLMNPMPGCASVRAADRQGARDAVEHLLKLGHRHLLHFYFDPHEPDTSWNRVEGFREAIRRHGLDPETCLQATWWSHDHKDDDRISINETLDKHPEITAILAPNDPGAVWLYEFLVERGLKVPRDMSLIGFDDTDPITNGGGENLLTTVRVPLEEIGRCAARLVIEQVLGQFPALELVVRKTTAPPQQ